MNAKTKNRFQKFFSRMEYTEAIRFAKIFTKNFPRDAEVWRFLALAYDQRAASRSREGTSVTADQKKARRAVLRGLRQSPKDPELLHVSGIISLHEGDAEAAFQAFRHAHRLEKNPRYLVSMANALRRLHRYAEAIRVYQKAKKFPELSKAVIQNNIAQTYLERGNLEAAVNAARTGMDFLKRKKLTPLERTVRQKLVDIADRKFL